MKPLERPHDLEELSSAEKDALILGLRQQLQAERTQAQALRQRLADLECRPPDRNVDSRELRARIRKTGAKGGSVDPASVKVRLGRELGLLRRKGVIAAVALATLAFIADLGVAWYQDSHLAQKRLAELQLQHAAFTNLYVELEDVVYQADGKSYRLTMTMENLDPESPIYVMLSPVRVFEQSGLVWKEVPARAPDGTRWGVVKLTDRRTYQTVFEPNVEDWAELIPGYMHIRFDNDMLISQRSEPTDDIVERKDPYYVYLKPHGADDEAIRQKTNYRGVPPVYIPMPPH
jgi:hypothetical protein